MSTAAMLDRFMPTSGQRAAAAALRDALRTPAAPAALLLVTGHPDAGKSAMLATVRDDAGGLPLGVVTADKAHADGRLLRGMIAAFDETPAGRSGLDLLTQLRAILRDGARAGQRPALLIDGAEALTGSQLEIVRSLLTPAGDVAPVAIVLIGRPELLERIRRRRPLARRRTHDIRLANPTREDLTRILDERPALADALLAAAARQGVAPLALVALVRREAGGLDVTAATLEAVLRRQSSRPATGPGSAVQAAMPFAVTPARHNGENTVHQLSLLQQPAGGER